MTDPTQPGPGASGQPWQPGPPQGGQPGFPGMPTPAGHPGPPRPAGGGQPGYPPPGGWGQPGVGVPGQTPWGGASWGAPTQPLTLEMLPPALRPALPTEPRDYFAFWRAPRYRWWKSLLAIALALGVMFVISGIAGAIGMAIDHVDPFEVVRTNQIPVGPGLFIANNISLGLAIPVAMLTAWVCVQQRPRWLTSVTGGMRWGWFWLLIAILTPLWAVLIGIGLMMAPLEGVGMWPHTVPMIVGILLTTPFQAAGEEYLVRGMLGRAVAAWFPSPVAGFAVSTVVTALVFMALHAADDPWLNVFYLTFGVAGSWLTWRTGGLEAAVALHIVNNMLSEVMLPFIDMSGMFDRQAGAADASVLINIGFLVGATLLIDFLARRRKLLTRNDPGRAELDAVLGGAPGVAPRG